MADESLWRHINDRHIDVVEIKRRLELAAWPDALPGLRWGANQFAARCDDVINFFPFFVHLMWIGITFRPKVIHANNEPVCNRAALLTGKFLRIPVVCHVRGQQQGGALMRYMFRLPTLFIPVSRWVSESIGNLGVPEHVRTVVYDGIELNKLQINANGSAFREAHCIPTSAFAVGLVGLLIPWKGQELFIDAARELAGTIPNLRMVVVGGTPDDCVDYERSLRARVIRENLTEIVKFTGHVTNMPEVYNGLDVVVSASTLPEPLGTVVIESMAMGRPLVGPNHGGAAEMTKHEETALLFAPGDADDLRRCIQQLHDDPDLAKRLGIAAREKALRTYSVDEHVRNIQAIYDEMLDGQ
jgi:glycosyltransferase involved in cell wall biosynthesis